nr:replication initiation factor domain-containing protein [uncultured Albidiferax sp.]
MTSPKKSVLVLDGNEVKLRLQAERIESKTPVHIDWLRFTVQRRNAPTPTVDVLFPGRTKQSGQELDAARFRINRMLDEVLEEDWMAAAQAYELAKQVAQALGHDFDVDTDIKKGHDFYKSRWPITRNGYECGWVGFGASSDSPKQQAQARTVHCNIFGAACTFALPGWNNRLAAIVEDHSADITRVDLALDFFDGLPGGMMGVKQDYVDGLCNSNGKRLKHNMIGQWADESGHGRSFYIGSKEAGKQTNIYEKGDQLFGDDAGSLWHRIELRYGNKLRVLPVDVLRDPSSFFAGASEWHSQKLAQAGNISEPQPIKATPRLPLETVNAEVHRTVRWTLNTAAAAMAVCWDYMGSEFLEFVTNKKLPGRLQKFTKNELSAAFETRRLGSGAALSYA